MSFNSPAKLHQYSVVLKLLFIIIIIIFMFYDLELGTIFCKLS